MEGPSLLDTALLCQFCFMACPPLHPPARQDRHTCLLQGPILCICVLAVLLIERRQQETTHHSLPALSPTLGPRARTQKGGRTAKGKNYGDSLHKAGLGSCSGLRALSKRRDCVKAVLGMEGDTFLHRKTFSDYGRLKA